jgi:predicted  nucleic acid-binding Zn-ribbon protein
MNNVDYIMHLGAGICSELPQYLSLSPQHIFLYEGAPSSYKRLTDKIKSHTNVSAFNTVITAQEQDVDFYVAQPTQFSGTRSPEQFKYLFKNLRITDTQTVSGVTLAQLIQHNSELTMEESNNLLVIQLNGQEADLIIHTDIALLAIFDTIHIQIPYVVCGDTLDNEHQQAINKLTDYGFVYLDNTNPKPDALHRYIALQQDPETVMRTKLKQQLIELESQHRQLNARYQSLENNEANLRSEFEQYQASIRDEFGELANQIEALETSKHHLQQALNNEKTQAKDQQAKFEQQVDNINQQVQQLKAEQEEAQELKRSERLTQKMLVKAQVDLDDLRSKYAVKVEQEQQLVNLVQELRDKLTLASKYYFKLQQAHPEVLSDTSLIKQEDER